MSLNLASLVPPLAIRPSIGLTDEELMRFSEEAKPYRIERNRHGEIVIMTPVGGIGSTYEADVAYYLLHWNRTTGAGLAFISNAGFNLQDGSCLSPDAAWLARDRWDALTLKQQTGYPPLCPDFIIEVRSESDSRTSVEEKMQLWMENGAKLAWLIDPLHGSLAIYRPNQPVELLNRPQEVEGEGPVAGFKLPCVRLWSKP